MASTDPVVTGNETAMQIALQTVEKKVRNLEKRKGKLDGYREDNRKGKELNDDQKAAIAKYDEVMQNLEFARELQQQFKTMIVDEERSSKKKLKKEAVERAKVESGRLASILTFQKIIMALSKPKVLEQFKSGENKLKMSKEQFGDLEEFVQLVSKVKSLDENDKETVSLAEHLISLAEAKPKKAVGKTSYKDLNDTFNSMKKSGFNFEEALNKSETETTTTTSTKVEKVSKANNKMTNGSNGNKSDHSTSVSAEATPVQEKSPEPQQHQRQQPVVPMPNAAAPPMFPPPPTMTFVPPTTQQPSINFLQESQIDMESPHMDPAVVMVHHTAPPVTTSAPHFNMYIPTTLAQLQHQQQQFGGHFVPPQQPQQQQQKGAPGFPVSAAAQVQLEQQPQQVMPKSPEEVNQQCLEQVASNEAEKKPPGFSPSQKEVKDEMPPIDDWNEEIAKEEENSENRDRGSRGGRGRGGRGGGQFRGRGGFKRGGGENGYRGNGENGYRGNGENGYRGGRGGGRGRDRDGNFRDREFRSSNRGGKREFDGERGPRGGQRGHRGGGGYRGGNNHQQQNGGYVKENGN